MFFSFLSTIAFFSLQASPVAAAPQSRSAAHSFADLDKHRTRVTNKYQHLNNVLKRNVELYGEDFVQRDDVQLDERGVVVTTTVVTVVTVTVSAPAAAATATNSAVATDATALSQMSAATSAAASVQASVASEILSAATLATAGAASLATAAVSSNATAVSSAAAAFSTATSTGGFKVKLTVLDGYQIAPMSIGGTTFQMVFDTGSSDLWIPIKGCTNCDGKDVYTATSAGTTVNGTFSITYGDSSQVSGNVYRDTITVGGATTSQQVFSAVDRLTSTFNKQKMDGILGLGYKGISNLARNCPTCTPWFFTAVAQGTIKDPRIGFSLRSGQEALYFGGIDTAAITGDITYTPVTQKGYWRTTADAYSAGGKAMITEVDSIIDTGTTLIVGPTAQITAWLKDQPGVVTDGQGKWAYNCNQTPSLSITYGGRQITLSPESLNLGTVKSGQYAGLCILGIMGADMQFFILGNVFMENVYTIYDAAQNQVGFAQYV